MDAEVITAILTPISIVILAYITYLTNRQAKKNHAVTEEVLVVATSTEHAVNGKAPGEASISQDVATIKDKQELDSPTVPLASDPPDGNGASLKLQVRYLTKLMEDLAGKKPPVKKPTTRRK